METSFDDIRQDWTGEFFTARRQAWVHASVLTPMKN
jgi:hypothetical protein